MSQWQRTYSSTCWLNKCQRASTRCYSEALDEDTADEEPNEASVLVKVLEERPEAETRVEFAVELSAVDETIDAAVDEAVEVPALFATEDTLLRVRLPGSRARPSL